MKYVGADPGKSGGIAIIDDAGGYVDFVRADGTIQEIAQRIHENIQPEGPTFAVVEKVASSPQMGVRSAFTFGKSAGGLEAVLAGAGVPYRMVSPSKWQGAMGCRSGGDKNVTKAAAASMFPKVKVTHRNADALLLAWYAKRWFEGEYE